MSGSRFAQEVSRRKLLKILAASGGAVAASTVLPGKWVRPIVDMGVLPAHAQLSGTFSIGNLRASESNSFDVRFDYIDPKCNVDENTQVSVWIKDDYCSETQTIYNQTLGSLANASWDGPCSGTIRINHINESGCSGTPLCNPQTRVELYEPNGDQIDTLNWKTFGDYANATCPRPS